MSYQFTLSDIGLRLIKAYEGYSPEARYTRDGRKIIGFGQLAGEADDATDETEAETMLKADLAGVEGLINTHVHAALTQSQFDALCSLAYSIGPNAFLDSDILHALNRGEVINAANGFDAWRLGNIDGNIYVVDALVRRRTAEKALFLRPTIRTAPAPHETLKAFQDETQIKEQLASTVKTKRPVTAPTNIVSLYQKEEAEMPPADETAEFADAVESEIEDATENAELTDAPVIQDDNIVNLTDPIEQTSDQSSDDSYVSPIEEAASEVSERLEALMEKDDETDDTEWPQSLADTSGQGYTIEQDAQPPQIIESENGVVIDYIGEDDALRETIDDLEFSSADRYIVPAEETEPQNIWAFITMIIMGLTVAGGGLWASLKNTSTMLGEIGPLVFSGAVAIGVLLLLMGLYYLMKHIFGRS